ncbi:hypothetical protein [uncultured Algibacter sp.]|uniref:hypothetical protein n=1 Tax=uncultured Algibacter sp. TaxID=298659 RepID=UPI00321798D3
MVKNIKFKNPTLFLDAFKNNNTNVFKRLYIETYSKTEAIILNKKGSVNLAKKIHQDAFLSVWMDIKNNTLSISNDTDLESYLFETSKAKWMKHISNESVKNTKPTNKKKQTIITKDGCFNIENKKLKNAVKAYRNLKQPCRELLSSIYFDRMPTEELAIKLNTEATVIKHQKYTCIETLYSKLY